MWQDESQCTLAYHRCGTDNLAGSRPEHRLGYASSDETAADEPVEYQSFFPQTASEALQHDSSIFVIPQGNPYGPYRLQIPSQPGRSIADRDIVRNQPRQVPQDPLSQPPPIPLLITEDNPRSGYYGVKRLRTDYSEDTVDNIEDSRGKYAAFVDSSSLNMQQVPHSAPLYPNYSPVASRDQFLDQQQLIAQQHLAPLSVQAHHHHHRLPTQLGHEPQASQAEEPMSMHSSASLVGQEGMPAPAPRPNMPKLKFSAEEDQKLVDLKEGKNLTWKQIADFFPGRSSGTLQVRYCTKLKAKTVNWADDSVSSICAISHFHAHASADPPSYASPSHGV